jgi:ankyrin repeat protein
VVALSNTRLVKSQHDRLLQLIRNGHWHSAQERFDRIRSQRPYLARLILQLDTGTGTPLHQCLGDPRAEAFVRGLLEAGADPNKNRDDWCHPLFTCISSHSSLTDSNLNLFELLLEFGANPNVSSEMASDLPLLHWAIIRGKDCFLGPLLRYGADPSFVVDGCDAFSQARHKPPALNILNTWCPPHYDWEHD